MLRTLFTLSLLAAAAPALAQAPYYSAQPAVAPEQARVVVRDSVWRCASGTCVAGRTPTRHALVCAGLARSVGELRRFAVDGEEFTAEQLANCNRRSR